jgi:hypothetical protein
MPTALIAKDEWYPVYCFTEFPTWTIEVTSEQIARWRAAFDAFWEIQEEIRTLVDPDD